MYNIMGGITRNVLPVDLYQSPSCTISYYLQIMYSSSVRLKNGCMQSEMTEFVLYYMSKKKKALEKMPVQYRAIYIVRV